MSEQSWQPSLLAQRLGWAGLLPFVALSAGLWLLPAAYQSSLKLGLISYGALIASFLGGMHWGLAMRQALPPERLLVWGVAPSLLAWPLVLWQAPAALLALAALLGLCWLMDRRLYPDLGLQAWLPLRGRLTLVATLSCLSSAWLLQA